MSDGRRMGAERDMERVVRSWLQEEHYESANRVLGIVLDLVDTTPQRRPWRSARRFPPMNTPLKMALALAAVLVAIVAGYAVLPRTTGVGTRPPLVLDIQGNYQTSFSHADLQRSPLLMQGEDNDGNYGDWTLSFHNGRVVYTQRNDVTQSSSSGIYTTNGDVLRLAFDAGANKGESFVYRWTLQGTTLTFRRDESLGAGPTPWLVKPWTRTQ